LTHADDKFYFYFKVRGNLSHSTSKDDLARFQIALDLDNDLTTGYCAWRSGYYPNSCGYDVRIVGEFFGDGTTAARYALHAATNQDEFHKRYEELLEGVVKLSNSTDLHYDWVFWDALNPPSEHEQQLCPDGPHNITRHNGLALLGSICLLKDTTVCPSFLHFASNSVRDMT
jgi:hypothetical protein